MYVIKVKDILNGGIEAVHVVVTDIDRHVDAWKIAESLASSHFDHGLDRTTKAYWFRDRSGLHYIWAERQKPVDQEDVVNDPKPSVPLNLYRRTERLLYN